MKIDKVHNLLLAVIVMLLVSTCSGFAIPYQAGKYKVDVAVRNSAMNLIPGIKVGCYQYDAKRLVVEVSASGYKYAKRIINIQENQTFYKCDFVLADLERKIFIVDHNDKVISSAYIREDQFGFPGDHYGITAYIPIVQWPSATMEKVDVFDSFWGVPLKKSCEISQIEEFYCVKLSITRKALKWSGSNLYVVFRTSQPSQQPALNRHLLQLKHLSTEEIIPPGAEESLAEYIAENYTSEEIENAGVAVPASLKWYLLAKKRFNELHRD